MKRLNCMICLVECLGHLEDIVPSLACILMKHGGMEMPFLRLNFKMFLGTSALKNLCLWCEFQSCLLFIISLLLKNSLTALVIGKHTLQEIETLRCS